MIGGAIINATAFVGGNYLAKYLSGDSAGEEKKRHDVAVEKYEKNIKSFKKTERGFPIGWPLLIESKMKRK